MWVVVGVGWGVKGHCCLTCSALPGAGCSPPPLPHPPTPSLPGQALATHPLKSSKRDPGLRDVAVAFAGVTVRPGDHIYADKDGILVSPEELQL